MSKPNEGLNEADGNLPNGEAQNDGGEGSNAGSTNSVDKVSLDTHRKTLNALKNSQLRTKELEARVAEWDAKQKEVEEKALQEKGEWAKLVELRTKELTELKSKLKEREDGESKLRQTLFDAAKLQAVRERLPGQLLKPEYAQFIDVEKVAFNPETNEIDEDSVTMVVDDFVRNHSGLIKRDGRQLPNGSPAASQKLSYDQWLKLPAKEKRTRLKDVEGFKGHS